MGKVFQEEAEFLSALGASVASKRKQKGYSQLRLALAADISKTYLCDLEHGRRNPSVAIVARICRELGITMKDLCVGIGPERKNGRKRKRN